MSPVAFQEYAVSRARRVGADAGQRAQAEQPRRAAVRRDVPRRFPDVARPEAQPELGHLRQGRLRQSVGRREAVVHDARHRPAGERVPIRAAQARDAAPYPMKGCGGRAEEREQALLGVLADDAQAREVRQRGPDVRVLGGEPARQRRQIDVQPEIITQEAEIAPARRRLVEDLVAVLPQSHELMPGRVRGTAGDGQQARPPALFVLLPPERLPADDGVFDVQLVDGTQERGDSHAPLYATRGPVSTNCESPFRVV